MNTQETTPSSEEKNPADLPPLTRFNQLDEEEKFFLQITALLDSDTPSKELFRIIKALAKSPGCRYRWRPEQAARQHNKLLQLELLDQHNRCHPEILEQVARRPLDKRALELCRQLIRSSFIDSDAHANATFSNLEKARRDFRLALLSFDFESLQQALPFFHQSAYEPKIRHPYAALTLYPFDRDWFLKFPLSFQFAALDDAITHSLEDLRATPELDNFITEHFPADQAVNRPFILLYSHKLLLSGRLTELEQLFEQAGPLFNGSGLKGAISTLKGNLARAAVDFAADLEFARSLNPNKVACFDAPIALFYIITAGHIQTATDWNSVAVSLNVGEQEFAYNPFTHSLFRLGETLLHFFRGNNNAARTSFESIESRPEMSIFTMLNNLISYWLTGSISEDERQKLENIKAAGTQPDLFPWVALECETMLSLSADNPVAAPETLTLVSEPGLKALTPVINFEPAWRRTLNAIRQVTPSRKPEPAADNPESGNRLAWFLEITPINTLHITPKVQRRNPDNRWTNGRNLAFERIRNGDELPCFTRQDRRICQAIRKLYKDTDLKRVPFDQSEIFQEMVGHPHLFRHDRPRSALVLNPGEVAVIIQQNPGAEPTFTIRLEPDLKERESMVVADSENRFTFYRNSPELNNIARLLGENGLTLPLEARDDIINMIRDLAATLPIYSDIDPKFAPAADEFNPGADPGHKVESDNNLYLQIFPSGAGLQFELKVKPLGADGPILTPGRGPAHLIANIAGKTRPAKRDLALETARAKKLLAACPAFDKNNLNLNWQIDNLEECLNTLEEIQSLQNGAETDTPCAWLVCEWPAGQKISLKKKVQGSAFKLRVESQQEWFKVKGELEIDENEVISLKELLQHNRTGTGRFLKLADGEFISLTEKLRERLLELSLYLNDNDKEESLLLHRGVMGGVAKIMENFSQVQYDQLWQEQMRRFQTAADFTPKLPPNLKTELRSYQVEGFNWLSRLAYLGFGACLADDMGLGKTVQTLTLILTRAEAGPTLVVAPTSVCGNWQKECKRFAPSLNPILFGGPERAKTIAGLKPFDLLICSYTMLQQEQQLIAGREWEIIVLDEAQAIKNMNTKRSQAAMSLNGKFRLITTGTPLENHLGELWNLFNFINPGLLGSLKQFTQRFALPIEHGNDAGAREHLRKLIQPYILRRKKSQVLKELPERTEILLEVKMSEAERNFYEAVRRQAIERLEEASDKKTGAASPSIQVLAELTRLRLAACNPRLIAPDTEIESAKLELFGRVIDNLLGGGHQALVFSQFVKHLNLIREYLDNKKISYRYLDGSTPKAKREDEINAFQEGQADLFLISLKAGGLGLNLTAADYVLHLDPWWNPAIEDQASDRAHRIGQTRPVTVYRLITKASIEEKIVRLHQEKRNLADQILTASDQSARFSTKELLQLIKTG